MDTITNDYIQDYLHSDKFIDLLEYFVAKYNENADSIRKKGVRGLIDDLLLSYEIIEE